MLLALLVPRVLAARAAVLTELEPFGALPPILGRAVVASLALSARQGHDFTHNNRPACQALGIRHSALGTSKAKKR